MLAINIIDKYGHLMWQNVEFCVQVPEKGSQWEVCYCTCWKEVAESKSNWVFFTFLLHYKLINFRRSLTRDVCFYYYRLQRDLCFIGWPRGQELENWTSEHQVFERKGASCINKAREYLSCSLAFEFLSQQITCKSIERFLTN